MDSVTETEIIKKGEETICSMYEIIKTLYLKKFSSFFKISASFRPYRLRFVSDSFEDAVYEASPGNGGFLLKYWQITC